MRYARTAAAEAAAGGGRGLLALSDRSTSQQQLAARTRRRRCVHFSEEVSEIPPLHLEGRPEDEEDDDSTGSTCDCNVSFHGTII